MSEEKVQDKPDLKSKLQQIKLKQNGQDLYNHLVNIFSKMMLDNQESYDLLEQYSLEIDKQKYESNDHDKFVDTSKKNKQQYGQVKEQFKKITESINPIMEGEDEEKQPIGAIGQVQNFVEDAQLFEQAGIGFGSEESLLIQKALIRLCYKKQATNVRIWGKILTSGKDYYVAEGASPNLEEPELPDGIDKQGEDGSINKNIYWVIQDLTQEWQPLPCVTAQQIIVSRQVKYMFTGDLNKKVYLNPWFEGEERHLLKCIVTRIQHCTQITPRTTLDAEENVIFPKFHELLEQANWVHNCENILREGRLVHNIVEPENPPDDFDPDKFKAQIEAADPFEPKLKPIRLDKPPSNCKNSWVLKSFGDCQDYQLPQFEYTVTNYGVILLKNMWWPGLSTIYQNQNTVQLYIGYGFKNGQGLYFPKVSEIIKKESQLPVDQDEPNFPPPEPEQPKEGEENQE